MSDVPSGGPLRECAVGEDSFMAALYRHAGDSERLEYMLRVIAGGMRAAYRLDAKRGDPTLWS